MAWIFSFYVLVFTWRPKRLLIYVNPFGGKRRGLEIYHKQVAPLFAIAGVSSMLVVTNGPHHAHEHLQSTSIESLDGIVCVGGDGTFAEVLTALLLRSACDANRNINGGDAPISPSLRLAMVPAGSTDTVAFCIHGTNDIETSVLHILLGKWHVCYRFYK
jgi:ceramide kinase